MDVRRECARQKIDRRTFVSLVGAGIIAVESWGLTGNTATLSEADQAKLSLAKYDPHNTLLCPHRPPWYRYFLLASSMMAWPDVLSSLKDRNLLLRDADRRLKGLRAVYRNLRKDIGDIGSIVEAGEPLSEAQQASWDTFLAITGLTDLVQPDYFQGLTFMYDFYTKFFFDCLTSTAGTPASVSLAISDILPSLADVDTIHAYVILYNDWNIHNTDGAREASIAEIPAHHREEFLQATSLPADQWLASKGLTKDSNSHFGAVITLLRRKLIELISEGAAASDSTRRALFDMLLRSTQATASVSDLNRLIVSAFKAKFPDSHSLAIGSPDELSEEHGGGFDSFIESA